MPAKWNRPVFWFRFYEGKISSAFFVLAAPDVPSPPCGKFNPAPTEQQAKSDGYAVEAPEKSELQDHPD